VSESPPQPHHTGKDELESRIAGIVSRGVAGVLDVAVVAAILGVLYLGFLLIGLLFAGRSFEPPDPNVLFSGVATYLVAVAYLAGCWSVSGRTVGSVAMGLEVVNRRGARLGPVRALVRAVLCTVFPIGLLWVAVDSRRRSAQDIVLRSRVIYAW
jgi:uncharacterized RDD family membrane protein YckC